MNGALYGEHLSENVREKGMSIAAVGKGKKMKRGLKRTPLPSNNIKVCLKFTNVLSNIKCRSFKHARQLQTRQLQTALGQPSCTRSKEHNLWALRRPPHPRGHTEALLGEKWEEEKKEEEEEI